MFETTSLKISSFTSNYILVSMISIPLWEFYSNICPFNHLVSNPKCNLNFFSTKINHFFWDKFVFISQAHLIWYTIFSLHTIWELLILIKYSLYSQPAFSETLEWKASGWLITGIRARWRRGFVKSMKLSLTQRQPSLPGAQILDLTKEI